MDRYITDYGEVQLPEKAPIAVCDHWGINRYYAEGPYWKYLRYIEDLAKYAFEHRGRLKIAPPFSVFYRKSYGRYRAYCPDRRNDA